jgi:hypothetical protein
MRRNSLSPKSHAALTFEPAIEQHQNTSGFGRYDLHCATGDNFRQFLISWHNSIVLFHLPENIRDQGPPTPT